MTTYAKPIQLSTSPRQHTDEQKKRFKTDLKKMYEEEKQLVKGRFLCFEPRGGQVSFVFRKYEWDQPMEYNLKDGEEYEIPLSVARHLNGIDITAKAINGQLHTCSYPVHHYQQDKTGVPSVNVGKRVRRYAFQTTTGETVN